MQTAEILREEMRHTRLVPNWLAEGRQEGRSRTKLPRSTPPPHP